MANQVKEFPDEIKRLISLKRKDLLFDHTLQKI